MWTSSAPLPGTRRGGTLLERCRGALRLPHQTHGLTFEDSRRKNGYLRPSSTGSTKERLQNPSGKVELYSRSWKKTDALLSPPTPSLPQARRYSETAAEYPFILTTAGGSRSIATRKTAKICSEGNRPPAGPPDPPDTAPAGNLGGRPRHRRDRNRKHGTLRRFHHWDPPRRGPGHAGWRGRANINRSPPGSGSRGDRLRAYAGILCRSEREHPSARTCAAR